MNIASGNNNTRYSCGNNGQGFQWVDATPAGATVTSVTVEFKIGVECAPNAAKSGNLNSVPQGNFSSNVNHCSLTTPGPAPLITMNLNAADYTIGVNNTFNTLVHGSCFGFERNAALNNHFARVTVVYQADVSCFSSLVPVTATVVPLTAPTTIASPTSICGSGSSSITASGAPVNGSYTWFSDQAGNNQIGTGANYNTGNLATTTTVYVQASNGNGSGNPETLTTTFAAGNNHNGNMFNINVLSNITITDFDVHSTVTGNFEVYYKTGSYQGAETNAGAWTLIGTANNITSNGLGNPTPLGLNLSLQLQSGAHAFYVTGTNNYLQYTNGTNNNNIYAQNNEIEFFEGVGKAYPFGATFSPRIWNGIINYTTGSQSTCLSALEPVTITIEQPSSAAASVSGAGSICLGTTSTLTVQGGALVGQSNWQWFSGNCTGTPIGTGASISVTPSATTSYFVSASANGVCPATSCAVGVVNLPAQSNILSANGSNQTCVVNANNYIHFMDPNTGDLIASVNSLGQNLGNVTITSYENGLTQDVESCSYPGDPLFTTAVMGRHWVITSEFTPTTSVDVLLPYHFNQYDLTAVTAFNNPNPDDNLNSQNDIGCTQYSGANENGIFTDNCNNGTFLWHNQNTTDQVNAILPNHTATDEYITISVDGFSEFWLHGSQNAQPLPVELTSFQANCMSNNKIEINWSTATEYNASHYIIERSIDEGESWEIVQEVNAVGFSQVESLYSIEDLKLGINRPMYYRLRQFDIDGSQNDERVISINCSDWSEDQIVLFPNPGNGEVTVQFYSSEKDMNSIILIEDLRGNRVSSMPANVKKGSNQIFFDVSELTTGMYMVKIVGAHFRSAPQKYVKH